MSGIVGLLHLDGSPVDVQLLRRMTAALAFRGPDAQETWVGASVGLAHTLLRTTDEAAQEHQPLSFDGRVWITADARVDARAELVSKLKAAGRPASVAAPDVELILHAYHAWGEDCVLHLLGDFAFAIWDESQRKLFCARDHFGVKPFFYAHVGNSVVFSNTLDCVRLHPAISDRFNELAIADFLLFGLAQELDTSTFFDVRRLPPAHSLAWSNGTLAVRCFWTLPTDGCVRYAKPSGYVEQFLALLRAAVEDRLRSNRFAILMSGGLDSPCVAALSKELLARGGKEFELRAHTVVYDYLIPDQERHYAGQVAQALESPIHFLAADTYEPFQDCDSEELTAPEPGQMPLLPIDRKLTQEIGTEARIAFTGYGADPGMQPSPHYLFYLVRTFRFWPIARSLAWYAWRYRRRPPMGGVRAAIQRWRAPQPRGTFPDWLNPDFVKRCDLRSRWERLNLEPEERHPVAPEAYRVLVGPIWRSLFESCDPGVTGVPLEFRHPFFDRRVLEYLLSIPPIPWYWDKLLLREALRGLLPEEVRTRRKAPLAADPIWEFFRRRTSHPVDAFVATPQLLGFVERGRIPPVVGENDASQVLVNLRPYALDLWLRRLSAAGELAARHGREPL